MKKLVFAIMLLCISLSPSIAIGGDLDGIWGNYTYVPLTSFLGVTVPETVFMVRENCDTVLIAEISLDDWSYPYGYNAYIGTRSGNTVHVVSAMSTVSVDMTITIYSSESATAVLNYCIPIIQTCIFPSGTELPIVKIF
jgi:hypothetical protein